MADTKDEEQEPFGAKLYSEIRKTSGFNIITEMLSYDAIQELKVADQEATIKIFYGCSYAFIKSLKSGNVEAAARQLVIEAQQRAQNSQSFNWIRWRF